MMDYPYSLETERLLLRSFEVSDRDSIYEIASAKEIYDSTVSGHYPYEKSFAESFVVTQQYQYFQGKRFPFAITLKDIKDLIGTVALIDEKKHNSAEIGYWLGVDYWGRGYAIEAAKAILNYGFKELKYHRIYASHMAKNLASGKVLQKIGLQREGTFTEHVLKDGIYHDTIYYGIYEPI